MRYYGIYHYHNIESCKARSDDEAMEKLDDNDLISIITERQAIALVKKVIKHIPKLTRIILFGE